MNNVEIVDVTSFRNNYFGTTTKNTKISMQDKHNETLKLLAGLLGYNKVYTTVSARNARFYSVDDSEYGYQSAANLILELARELESKSKT